LAKAHKLVAKTQAKEAKYQKVRSASLLSPDLY
jgi:hypothetical protein